MEPPVQNVTAFRRRTNGALLWARQCPTDEHVIYGDIKRSGRLVNRTGQITQEHSGVPHEVTVRAGEWIIYEGSACYPMPDNIFRKFAVRADELTFTPHIARDREFYAVAQIEAEAAVARGERPHQLPGYGQNAREVQEHSIRVLSRDPASQEKVRRIRQALR